MEYCALGSVADLISKEKSLKSNSITEEVVASFIRALLSGVNYLHKKGLRKEKKHKQTNININKQT